MDENKYEFFIYILDIYCVRLKTNLEKHREGSAVEILVICLYGVNKGTHYK